MFDHNGVVNNKINLASRVDLIGFSSKTLDSISHGSEIHNERDTSEILENDSCRLEGNLNILGRVDLPVEDLFDISRSDVKLIAVSQSLFEENSDGVGQSVDSCIVESTKCVVLLTFKSRDVGEQLVERVRLNGSHLFCFFTKFNYLFIF